MAMPEWLQITLAVGSPVVAVVAALATVKTQVRDIERRLEVHDRRFETNDVEMRAATKTGDKAVTLLEFIKEQQQRTHR